jgi:acetylornithine deacetylase/succinyl-diaminopimelate desuccinylase-like protein
MSDACDNHSQFVADLQTFVRFPSVSGQTQYANALGDCARWLSGHLREIGLEQVETIPTPRNPIVYGRWRSAHLQPTVLIYGHYDVQPAEPIAEWRSPPFGALVHGDYLYGRGSADDKGQIFVHLKAIETYLRSVGRLPINVKCIIEGEEEIGSPNPGTFIERNKAALAADVVVISDTLMAGLGRPAVTYALRGALSAEIQVEGAAADLHSGNYGGAVCNPMEALAGMIGHLHDASGRVAIPGFYDQVRTCSPGEREFMARNGPSDAQLLADMRAARGWGEPGFSLYERTTIRPALTLNGIAGGYQGEGPKAVLPAHAVAKLDFRLVPDQEPDQVAKLLKSFVTWITPPTVRSRVRIRASAKPIVVSRNHPAVRAAARAYVAGFGVNPIFRRLGGTIPVVRMLADTLNIPVVMMGFAAPQSQIHAPNERLYLSDFFKGIATSMHFLAEVGAMSVVRDFGTTA